MRPLDVNVTWDDLTPAEQAEGIRKVPRMMERARLQLLEAVPFLSAFIMKIEFHPVKSNDPDDQTMMTDRYLRVYSHPVIMYKWTTEQIMGIVLHEIKHVAHGHFDRARQRNLKCWNIAGDVEINQDVIADGFELPSDAWLPVTIQCPEKKLAEFYYDEMIWPYPKGNTKKGCPIAKQKKKKPGKKKPPEKKKRKPKKKGPQKVWKVGDKVTTPTGMKGTVISVSGPDDNQDVTIMPGAANVIGA